MFLFEVVQALESEKLKYAIVGGYALALHGIVRATVDVDIVLCLVEADFKLVESAFLKINLKSRLPVRAEELIKMRLEYIENRNLLAWSFVDYQNPTRQVDILLTEDVRRMETKRLSVGGKKISVVSLKKLLEMKLKAARPQDLIDVESIKKKLHEDEKNKN